MKHEFSHYIGRLASGALTIALIYGCMMFVTVSKATSSADDDSSATQSDHALMEALAHANKKAASSLLDTDFTWTNADGEISTKAEALEKLSALAADNQGDTDVQGHSFGQVERIVGSHHGDRFVRIWVKRPEGWRAFIDLDTPIPANGYSNHPSPPRMKNENCTNPCRDLPYKPANAAQEAAMQTWLKLKMDEWHAIVDDWPKHVSENMVIISPGMYMTKEQRLALLEQQHEAYGDGSPSAPVASMRMFNFGNTVIMTALHAANAGGRHSYAVRMFVNEGGDWKMALSVQTDIKRPTVASD